MKLSRWYTCRLFAEWVDDMACDVDKIMGASRTHFVNRLKVGNSTKIGKTIASLQALDLSVC
jgi:hypothetical protein